MGNSIKHIDVRYHFVTENIEDRIVKVIFAKCEENAVNALTKSLRQEIIHKHALRELIE